MRVGLVYPLIQRVLQKDDLLAKWPPLGLLYIASSLEKNGHQVRLFERRQLFNINQNISEIDEKMLRQLKDFEPQLIGISATTPLISDALYTVKLISKNMPGVPLAIGGVHPTIEPLETLGSAPEIDYLIRGEGEKGMLMLADRATLKEIPGLVYRNGSDYNINDASVSNEKLDYLPFPARHLLDKDFYFIPDEFPYLVRQIQH